MNTLSQWQCGDSVVISMEGQTQNNPLKSQVILGMQWVAYIKRDNVLLCEYISKQAKDI